MKFQVTLSEILAHGNWHKYCTITGLNEWCLNEGLANSDEKILLTVEELNFYEMLGFILSEVNRMRYVPA